MPITPEQARAELRRRAALRELQRRAALRELRQQAAGSGFRGAGFTGTWDEPTALQRRVAEAQKPIEGLLIPPGDKPPTTVGEALGRAGAIAAQSPVQRVIQGGRWLAGKLQDKQYDWSQFEKSVAGSTENVVGAVLGSAEALARSGLAGTGTRTSAQMLHGTGVIDPDKWATDIWKGSQRSELQPKSGAGPWSYVQHVTGQALPYMVASYGATAAGGPVGGFAVGFVVEGDNAYRQAIAEGAAETEAQTERVIVGTINGALEMLQANRLLKLSKGSAPVLQTIKSKAAQSVWRRLAGKAGKIAVEHLENAIFEGIQEALQEAVQIGAAMIHGNEIELADAGRIGQAGLGGATAALLLGAPSALVGQDQRAGKAPGVTKGDEVLPTLDEPLAPMATPESEPPTSGETPPPGTTPAASELPAGGQPFSIRNAAVAEARERMGLPTRKSHEPQTMQQWRQEAIEQGIPERALEIADQIIKEPRAMTPQESQGFEIRMQQILDAYEQQAAAVEKLAIGGLDAKAAIHAMKTLREDFSKLAAATEKSGTPASYALLSRKATARLLADETNALAITSKAQEVKGDKLTDAEQAAVEQKVKEVKEAKAKADTVRQTEVGKHANRVVQSSRGYRRYRTTTEAEKNAELQQLIAEAGDEPTPAQFYQMTLNLGSRPGVTNIGDVFARLQQYFPKLTRDFLEANLIEYRSRKAKATDLLAEQLSGILREPWINDSIKTDIEDFLYWLTKGEARKRVRRLRRPGTEHTEALKQIRAFFRDMYQDSEPAMQQRLEAAIRVIDSKLASGDFGSRPKRSAKIGPMTEALSALTDIYNQKRAELKAKRAAFRASGAGVLEQLTKDIAELEQKVAERDTTHPTRGGRPREMEEIDALRAQKRALQDKLTEIARDKQRVADLKTKINQYRNYLATGKLPRKAPKLSRRADPEVEQLQNVARELEKQIAKSEPAVAERLKKTLAFLNARIANKDYGPKVKAEKPLRSEELEKLDYQVYRARQELKRRINNLDPWWKNPRELITRPFREIQTWKSAADFSALARQGGIALRSHPIRTLRRVPRAVRAMFDPELAWKINEQIVNGDRSWYYHRAGLDFTAMDGPLTGREEAFAGSLIEQVPYIGAVVRGSNRGFVTLLNSIRADSFDAMTRAFAGPGGLSLAESQALARYVNIMTGRGSLYGLEKYAPVLNGFLWSPQNTLSRIQYRIGIPLWTAPTWRVRRAIAIEYARYLVGLAVCTWLYQHIFGGTVETDRRSADYGKIVVGNTRLDPQSGLSQVTVLLEREIRGETKTQRGQIVPLRGAGVPYRGDTRITIATKFVRSKLGFLPGKIWDWTEGKDFTGQPITLKHELFTTSVPLSFEEVGDLMQDQGVSKGLALQTLNLFGEGVQVYEPQTSSGGPTRRTLRRRKIRR